jgi:predicted nucleotidyltransferase
MGIDPRSLIERLGRDIGVALGDRLLGLYVHGSWVLGDFDARRSDVDLLAVVADDPSDLLGRLLTVHDQLTADHPEWTDRVEVEYASVAALAHFRSDPRPMVRISPGEPLHVVPATRHYLLNWYAAREYGTALDGPPPRDLIPEITAAEWTDAIRDHVRQWPEWVADMHTPGAQAYAVLTLCRARHSLATGRPVSKRAAATWAAATLPAWTDLITWAARSWYEPAGKAQPDRWAEVTRFVDAASAAAEEPVEEGVAGVEGEEDAPHPSAAAELSIRPAAQVAPGQGAGHARSQSQPCYRRRRSSALHAHVLPESAG